MKVALIGTGKTGSKVAEILGDENVVLFNRSNPATTEKLKSCDVIISFLPGPAFLDNLDVFVESKLPLVTGSTGFEWPKDIDDKLKKENLTWIYASNFSLGMNLIRQMIESLAKANSLFDDYSFSMHEVHHVHKQDAPSGTALSWAQWLDDEVNITHAREGDVIGEHQIELKTPFEVIKLSHSATDRKIFASGAIWAAKKLTRDNVPAGLHSFSDITRKELL